MVTITDIIISETGKKINEVLLSNKVKIKLPKSNLKRFRKLIEWNHRLAQKQDIIVSLKYTENGHSGNN